MPCTVAELARSIGATVIGPGNAPVDSCNTLARASVQQISFYNSAKYLRYLESTDAAAVIAAPGAIKNITRNTGKPPLTILETKDPYFAWQQALVQLMGHRQHKASGISPLASIHPSARIAKTASIHPFAVIGENAVVGENTNLYPHVTLLANVTIGNDTTLYPNVTVYENCIIGNRCLINAGTVIGSDGFSYAQQGGLHHKVPQNGNVLIEDDVEIGCNAIIERAVLETTTIGRGTKIGNVVVVGHNCIIGQGNLLISQVGIAGSTTTGKYVVMAGQVGVNGHLDIPDFVKVGAQSGVLYNPEPNTEILGTPAMESTHARRVYSLFVNLPDLVKRLKTLEKTIENQKNSDADTPRP